MHNFGSAFPGRGYICAMKILMVCLGNICRSPLAEGILQNKADKAGLDWTIESGGTNGCHIGDAPHPLSQKVAKLNGIDISTQQARQFLPEDFENFDKMINNMLAGGGEERINLRRSTTKKLKKKKIVLLINKLYPGQNIDVP